MMARGRLFSHFCINIKQTFFTRNQLSQTNRASTDAVDFVCSIGYRCQAVASFGWRCLK